MSKYKCDLRINGGTAVRSSKNKLMIGFQFGLVLAVVLAASSSALAQGLIFGTVSNSDLTVPANGQIQFIGYVNDADDEIRLESSVGAGYDAGNWFDDFRNYLSTAPGDPLVGTVSGGASLPDRDVKIEDIWFRDKRSLECQLSHIRALRNGLNTVRAPAVAGTFYTADPVELARSIDSMLARVDATGPAPKGIFTYLLLYVYILIFL